MLRLEAQNFFPRDRVHPRDLDEFRQTQMGRQQENRRPAVFRFSAQPTKSRPDIFGPLLLSARTRRAREGEIFHGQLLQAQAQPGTAENSGGHAIGAALKNNRSLGNHGQRKRYTARVEDLFAALSAKVTLIFQ